MDKLSCPECHRSLRVPFDACSHYHDKYIAYYFNKGQFGTCVFDYKGNELITLVGMVRLNAKRIERLLLLK